MIPDMISTNETTDLSKTLEQLNNDELDEKTGMSGIDMRSRLSFLEIPAILSIDTLVSLDVLPKECLQLTRQKKRLSVSLLGMGRKEIVKIAVGSQDEAQGMFKPSSPIGLLKRKKEGN